MTTFTFVKEAIQSILSVLPFAPSPPFYIQWSSGVGGRRIPSEIFILAHAIHLLCLLSYFSISFRLFVGKKALVCLLIHLVHGDVVLVRCDVQEERPQLLALQVAHAGDAVLHVELFLFYLLLFTDYT